MLLLLLLLLPIPFDDDDNDGGVEADGVEDFSVETVVAAASVVDDDLVEPVDSERFEDNLL